LTDYIEYVKRIVDLLLVALFLGALALGGYELGKRVDRTSNQESSRDSELNRTTTTATHHHGPSGRTVYFVVGGLAIGVGAIMIGSLVGSAARSRRREHWRAT
jgi:hypothetical protein